MTSTRARCPSLVQYFPSPQPHTMKYNNTQSYNGGIPFDIESSSFNVSGEFAHTLDTVSRAIGKVYCFIKGNTMPRGSTTGFCFADHHHILTTSDLLQDEHGVVTDLSRLEFGFTLRTVTKDYPTIAPYVMPITYAHCTRTLLLLRLNNPLPAAISPLMPNKSININSLFNPDSNSDKFAIGIVGYCGRITLTTALNDYNSLPAEIRENIRAPTVDDFIDFPAEHKAFFPGRILAPLEVPLKGEKYLYTVSASVHGCSGAPVFCPVEPNKFIGVVFGGDHIANDNTILSISSPEFDAMFLKL